MKVVAIIPCVGHRDLVAGAIGSFFASDGHDHLSAVVVHDGSADGAMEGLLDRAIGWIRTDVSLSPAAARNLAIRSVGRDADAFAFLDADDEYEPEMVDVATRTIRGQGGRPTLVYADELYEDLVLHRHFVRFREPFSMAALTRSNIVGGSFVATRSALELAGPFDERMPVAEMYDMAWRVAEHSAVVHVPGTLVRVRLTPESLRHTVPDETWRASSLHAAQAAEARKHAKGQTQEIERDHPGRGAGPG